MSPDDLTVHSQFPIGAVDGAAWSNDRRRKPPEKPARPAAETEEEEGEDEAGHIDLRA